jgi:hypothetical protein
MTTATFMECDKDTLISQIGMMNIMAISGGRGTFRPTGVTLPVSHGYVVEVDLATNDTYTVQRVMFRAGKRYVKGVRTDVYCDQVGEMAYQASCYRNVQFGEAN